MTASSANPSPWSHLRDMRPHIIAPMTIAPALDPPSIAPLPTSSRSVSSSFDPLKGGKQVLGVATGKVDHRDPGEVFDKPFVVGLLLAEYHKL